MVLEKGKEGLPDGWVLSKLGEVCDINPSRDRDLEREPNTPTTFVPMPAVDEVHGRITKSEVKPFDAVKKGYTYFRENDVIFAKITPCMQNGKHAIARDLLGGFGFGSTEFHVLRPSGEILAEWIHAFVRRPDILELAEAQMTGAVGQQRVPPDFLASLKIPLPPLETQRRIAVKLESQMKAVETARIAAEEQLKIARVLTSRFLRSTFESEEARGWDWLGLGQIAFVSGGIQKSPNRAPRDFHKAYLTVRNVQRGWLDLTNLERFEVTPAEFNRLKLQDGDLLIVEGNGSLDHIGRNAIFRGEVEDCIHQNHVIRVRLNPGASSDFMSFYLNSPPGKAQMEEKAKSTTGLHTLSVSKIQSLEIPLPPLEDQNRIVSKLKTELEGAQQLVRSLEEQLETINAMPAALLREAFSGKA